MVRENECPRWQGKEETQKALDDPWHQALSNKSHLDAGILTNSSVIMILSLNLVSFSTEGGPSRVSPTPNPTHALPMVLSVQGFEEFFEESLPICLCTWAP